MRVWLSTCSVSMTVSRSCRQTSRPHHTDTNVVSDVTQHRRRCHRYVYLRTVPCVPPPIRWKVCSKGSKPEQPEGAKRGWLGWLGSDPSVLVGVAVVDGDEVVVGVVQFWDGHLECDVLVVDHLDKVRVLRDGGVWRMLEGDELRSCQELPEVESGYGVGVAGGATIACPVPPNWCACKAGSAHHLARTEGIDLFGASRPRVGMLCVHCRMHRGEFLVAEGVGNICCPGETISPRQTPDGGNRAGVRTWCAAPTTGALHEVSADLVALQKVHGFGQKCQPGLLGCVVKALIVGRNLGHGHELVTLHNVGKARGRGHGGEVCRAVRLRTV